MNAKELAEDSIFSVVFELMGAGVLLPSRRSKGHDIEY
jgi:hypothetical protein